MKIGFIGGGNMATALIGGLLEQGFLPQNMYVIEKHLEQANRLEIQFPGIQTYGDISDAVPFETLDVIVFAVKPQNLRDVAEQLQPFLEKQLVISIAAGIRTRDLSRWLGEYNKIVRCMPNTPALVQAGMSGLYAMAGLSDQQKDQAQTILEAVGEFIWVEDEAQIDEITGISGSGPAYVFYFMESLEKAAQEMGFAPEVAKHLVLSTFKGAVQLAGTQATTDFATLRQQVTSKGGTTEKALGHMEAQAVQNAIIQAAKAAAERARELADLLAQSTK